MGAAAIAVGLPGEVQRKRASLRPRAGQRVAIRGELAGPVALNGGDVK
jgi:hypothetical protein